ncbi:DUF7261 family protein [Halorientalis halophila]|uniref:DUF7261 family protein n=1 Tax=Halorientalis halophila TaxID=3108499 RepID=UPI00300907B4
MVTPIDADDRGQLLLVGSVAIALVIVGVVVMVNGMMFDDSIGARDNDDALADAERTIGMIESDLNALAREVRMDTRDGSGDFAPALRRNISLYSRHHTNLTFDNGIVYTNVTFDGAESINGTTIWQTQSTNQGACDRSTPYPRFTLETGGSCEANPTIVEDADAVTDFQLTVENPGTGASPETSIVVDNGAETWRLRMDTQPNGSVVVHEESPGGTSRVGVFDPSFDLELQDSGRLTVGGSESVVFAEGVDPQYDIGFENTVSGGGTALTGTYTISTDGDPSAGIGSQPETLNTVVSPAIEIYYQRQEVTYDRTILLNESGVR